MALSERLAFVVEFNAASAEGAVKRFGSTAERELGKADGGLNKLGGRLQTAGVGAIAFAGVAVGALVSVAKASEEAAIQALKLTTAIKNSGESFDRAALDDQATALQAVTVAEGDAITGMQGLLVQFGLTQTEITEATPLIIDLSQRMGIDLETAARAVARSIDGTGTALGKMGIETGVAKGAADNFERTMDALAGTVGGFAEEQGKTLGGQLTILKNQLGDVAEGIGAGVIPAFVELLGPVKAVAERFTRLSPQSQAMIGRFAALGTGVIALAGGASLLAGTALKMANNFSNLGAGLGLSATQMTKVGQAAGAAGILIAGAATAWTIWSSAMDAAEARTNEIADTIDERLANDSTFDELTGNYQRLTQGIADLDAAHRGSQAPWDADARREQALELDVLREDQATRAATITQVRELAEAQGISLDAATRIVQGIRDEEAAHADLVDTLGEEGAAEQESVNLTQEVEAAMARRRAATDRVLEGMRRLREEQERQNEALLSQLDLELQLRESNRDSEEAYADYLRAIEEFGAGSREAQEAEDALVEQHLRTAEVAGEVAAAREVAEGRITTATAASRDAQIASLIAVLNQIGPDSPLRRGILEHIQVLESIPRNIGTDITVSGNTAGTLRGVKAIGGRVQPGAEYVVGEHRPELFVPDVAGTIVPNVPVAIGGGSAAAVQIVQNIYGSDDELVQRVGTQVAMALRLAVA